MITKHSGNSYSLVLSFGHWSWGSVLFNRTFASEIFDRELHIAWYTKWSRWITWNTWFDFMCC